MITSSAILALAIVLWLTQIIPISVTSLLVVGLLSASSPDTGFGTAAIGFSMEAVFFLIAANLIAKAVTEAGLMERLSAAIAGWTSGSPRKTTVLLAVATHVSALAMPSALARTKMLLPIAENVAGRLATAGPRQARSEEHTSETPV